MSVRQEMSVFLESRLGPVPVKSPAHTCDTDASANASATEAMVCVNIENANASARKRTFFLFLPLAFVLVSRVNITNASANANASKQSVTRCNAQLHHISRSLVGVRGRLSYGCEIACVCICVAGVNQALVCGYMEKIYLAIKIGLI